MLLRFKYFIFLILVQASFAQLPIGSQRNPIYTDNTGAGNVLNTPLNFSNQFTIIPAPTTSLQVVRYADLTNTASFIFPISIAKGGTGTNTTVLTGSWTNAGTFTALTNLTVRGVFVNGANTYPILGGTSNQVLTTDGAGNISFSTVSASGGGNVFTASNNTFAAFRTNLFLGPVLTSNIVARGSVNANSVFVSLNFDTSGRVITYDTANTAFSWDSGSAGIYDTAGSFMMDTRTGTKSIITTGGQTINLETAQLSGNWSMTGGNISQEAGRTATINGSLFASNFVGKAGTFAGTNTGIINIPSNISSISRQLSSSGNVTLDYGGSILYDNDGQTSADWNNRKLVANSGGTVLNWSNQTFGATWNFNGGFSSSASQTDTVNGSLFATNMNAVNYSVRGTAGFSGSVTNIGPILGSSNVLVYVSGILTNKFTIP